MSDLRVPDLNHVMIAGRLTRDPELKYTAGNRAYCRFGIANTRYYRTRDDQKAEETVFASVSCWDKQAEWVGEKIKKGRPVLIEGSLNSYSFTDKDSGKDVTRLEIRARRIKPLDWDNTTDDGGTSSTRPQQQPQATTAPRPIEEPIPEDDIPF